MADQSWQELDTSKKMWKDHAWFFRVLRGVVLIIILGLIGITIYTTTSARESFSVNVFTAVMSAVATALIFDELNRRRIEEEVKRQLVIDAASISNEFAKNAVHQLWRRGWLRTSDGLLKGADLTSASLQGAVLMRANLQGADLTTANLQGANLRGADLRGTRLGEAKLQGADLWLANLEDADLTLANLRGANLKDVDLRGTCLYLANLQGANFTSEWQGRKYISAISLNRTMNVDEHTILPDGTPCAKEEDIFQFTDPKHPVYQKSPFKEEFSGN